MGIRGTYAKPLHCTCALCKKYKWTELPFWAHTPFEVYRVITGGMAYIFTREEFKAFLSGGAWIDRILNYGRPNGRSRILDQVQGGYLDWATYWTLDLISEQDLNRLESRIVRDMSIREMAEEERIGVNFNFDDEADGVFPIEFRKKGRLLTKNGIWITRRK